MAEIVFPRPWQRQPQQRRPLKNPGFWRLVDVQNHPPIGNVTRTLNVTARRGNGRGGPCADYPVAGDYISYGSDANLQLSTMTGLVVVEMPNPMATRCVIFNTNTAGVNSAGFMIHILTNGTVQAAKLDIAAIGQTTKAVRLGTGISTVAWSYNNVSGLLRIAIDGVFFSSTSAQTFTHGLVARNKYYLANATYSTPHKDYLFALSASDALSNSQLTSLSLNPWQIYKPREVELWTPDAIPGGAVIPVFANHYRNQGIM